MPEYWTIFATYVMFGTCQMIWKGNIKHFYLNKNMKEKLNK